MENVVVLKGDFIKLYQALKHVMGISGGEAKEIISFEDVYVNGTLEKQRGKKLRSGDHVLYKDIEIRIQL